MQYLKMLDVGNHICFLIFTVIF